MRRFFLLSLLLLSLLGLSAQSPMPGIHHVENFTEPFVTQTGQTWDIALYDDDWVYFANKNGILQYNGSEWTEYHLNNGSDIRSVYADRASGRIYVGGINEFGYLSPNKDGFITYKPLSDKLGNTGQVANMWGIYADKGDVYVQGDHSVVLLSRGKAKRVDSSAKLNCSNLVKSSLYFGTEDGLYVLVGDKILPAYGSDILRGKSVKSIVPYYNGVIVATSYSGIYFYDGNSVTPLTFSDAAQPFLSNIFCAAVYKDILAVGTITSGLTVIDLRSGRSQHYTQQTGLQDNTVLSLAFDDSGNLWAGLDRGIDRIILNLPMVRLTDNDNILGSTYDIDIFGDKVYCATNRALFTSTMTVSYPSTLSFSIFPGLIGQAWGVKSVMGDIFCMHDKGLFQLVGQSCIKIGNILGAWDIIPLQGSSNRALVGAYDGLFVIERSATGAWSVIAHIGGLGESIYNYVQEDKTHIWYSKSKVGAIRITIDATSFKIIQSETFGEKAGLAANIGPVTVSNIEGRVCFATQKGVYYYDKATNSIRPSSINKHLAGRQRILRVEQYKSYLFVLTPFEVMRMNLHTNNDLHILPIIPFGTKHPHPAYPISLINDSILIYPSKSGYSLFNLAQSFHTTSDTRRCARINKVSLTAQGDSIIYTGNFMGIKTHPKIDYAYNSVKFSFGVDPRHNSFVVGYQYRLDNDKWSELSNTTNVKEYTNLYEGDYKFQVRAMLTDGTLCEDSFEFTIRAPWYRSVLAKIIYFLLILGLIIYTYILGKRKIAKKALLVEQRMDAEMARQQEEYTAAAQQKDMQISKLEEEKLRGELDHKSQEIINLLLSVSSKNEALMNIKEELRGIISSIKGDASGKHSLNKLMEQIDSSLQSDTVLNRVEKEFDMVHNNFIRKMRETHPDLTPNELMMCMYIKMNLSTKEIAPLMNLSVRGVETIRYRMRKKLGLERADNLSEYILKM
jgi:DNA-binding CsgD family transcriptional regulator